jgi:hypothetical protein
MLFADHSGNTQCCLPNVATFHGTAKSVFIDSSGNSTFVDTHTTYMDLNNHKFRLDSISSVSNMTEILFEINDVTYNYIITANVCMCTQQKNAKWQKLCVTSPLLQKSNIGKLPAIQYGIQKISPDYSTVNVESQWTIEADNDNCWLVSDENMKIVPDTGIFLQSGTYFGHSTQPLSPSLFTIPSNCPSMSDCKQ